MPAVGVEGLSAGDAKEHAAENGEGFEPVVLEI